MTKYKHNIIYILIAFTCIIILYYLYNIQATQISYYREYLGDSTVSFMITSDMHIDMFYDNTIVPYGGSPNTWQIRTGKSAYPFDIAKWDGELAAGTSPDEGDLCDADPPITILYTMVKNYIKTTSGMDKPYRNFFFTGDTHAHKMALTGASETKIMDQVFTILLNDFNPDNIFYTPGNHDGSGDNVFYDPTNEVTMAWADALINKGIMKGTPDEVNFFKKTGYYIKNIPHTNLAVIIFNSMLPGFKAEGTCSFAANNSASGCVNNNNQCDIIETQKKQFYKDLASIKNGTRLAYDGTTAVKGVYVLMHYPACSVFTPMLNDDGFKTNRSVILNLFSGHMHDPNLYSTTVGGVQTYNVPPITFGKGTSYYLNTSITTPFSDPQKPMLLSNQNIVKYNCNNKHTFS